MIVYFALLFTATLSTCSGVTGYESKVDAFLRKVLSCHQEIPGLSVSVVKNDAVLMATGYGVTDLTTGHRVTNKTLFRLASLSKAFSATLVSKQLQKHQNMNIYTHLQSLLGSNFQFSSTVRTENANIRDILSHTLAIPKHNWLRLNSNITRHNFPSLMKNIKSIYPFRETYVYTNVAYGLITRISEILGDKPWEDLIDEEIYQPLGMTSSTFLTRSSHKHNVAEGYTWLQSSNSLVPVPHVLYRSWDPMCGAICVMSNAVDMSKWMKFHLSGGKNTGGKQVVDTDVLSSTYKPRNTISSYTKNKDFSKPKIPVSSVDTNYALGWKNGFYSGYQTIRHTGTILGFSSLLTLIPDMNIGIFTSMSGRDPDYTIRTLLHSYLADIAMDISPWLNISSACTFPRPWYSKPHIVLSSIDKSQKLRRLMSVYVGRFENDIYGNIFVYQNSTSSSLVLKYGVGTWHLYPQHTTDIFSGEGFGVFHKIYNLDEIKFTGSTHQGHFVVSAVKVTSFEEDDPPIFTKSTSKVHNSEIVG